jgi:hypothetical protein
MRLDGLSPVDLEAHWRNVAAVADDTPFATIDWAALTQFDAEHGRAVSASARVSLLLSMRRDGPGADERGREPKR